MRARLQDQSQPAVSEKDGIYYLLAALCGIGTGWADVAVNDLLFTALLVLASCMVLGLARWRRPWRWVLAVGVFIPLTELAAYEIQTVKPSRAQVYGSFLAFLPGIAGAYGGSFMRGVIDNLREGK
jgi:ABC-type multidrug transport system permease subunit